MNPIGGIEFDGNVSRKRKWIWWDKSPTHGISCNVPPFQPIMFTLNDQISVKIIDFDKINISFTYENQICKFRVGSKLKVIMVVIIYFMFFKHSYHKYKWKNFV